MIYTVCHAPRFVSRNSPLAATCATRSRTRAMLLRQPYALHLPDSDNVFHWVKYYLGFSKSC